MNSDTYLTPFLQDTHKTCRFPLNIDDESDFFMITGLTIEDFICNSERIEERKLYLNERLSQYKRSHIKVKSKGEIELLKMFEKEALEREKEIEFLR